MKGLIIKDLKLMKNNISFFLLMFVVAIGIGFYEESFTESFVIFLVMSFVLSTISYDEYHHGYAFLFTLPISRKKYCLEKYMFAFFVGLLSGIISLGSLLLIKHFLQQPIDIMILLQINMATLMLAFFFVSFMIPIQIYFGSERIRLVIILVIGTCMLIGFLLKSLGVDISFIFNWLDYLPIYIYPLITIIVVFLSYQISYLIMKHKEF